MNAAIVGFVAVATVCSPAVAASSVWVKSDTPVVIYQPNRKADGSPSVKVGKTPALVRFEPDDSLKGIEFVFDDDETHYKYAVNVWPLLEYTDEVRTVKIPKPDWGQQPSREAVMLFVAAYLDRVLFDSESARVQWGELLHTWRLEGDTVKFMWMLKFEVNAKNQLGGYTGWKSCQAFIKDDKVTDVEIPN